MKRLNLAMLVLPIAILCFVVSCGTPTPHETTPTTLNTNTEQIGETAVSEYSVSIESYLESGVSEYGCNIKIEYPKVIGLFNAVLEERINQKILTVFLGNYINTWQWTGLDVEATCEVMRKDDILSVISRGKPVVATPHPGNPTNFIFTLNIDMKSGQILNVEDILLMKDIESAMIDGNYELVEGLSMILEEYTPVEFFARYEKNDIIRYDANHNYDFFLCDDKLGIVIYVGAALGDIVIFELKVY